ncbi:MAG: DUF4350 domain-containing protein [Acidiferrobacterales bacterium]
MKDRVISLLGALAALYIFVAIFIHPQASDFIEQSRATSEDQGAIGLNSLYTWLKESGVPVYRLQRRYGELGHLNGLAASGNLLVVTLPQLKPVRDQELDQLRTWVALGNNLLVVAASSDSQLLNMNLPYQYNTNKFLREFGFSLHFVPLSKEEIKKNRSLENLGDLAENQANEREINLVPVGKNALTKGVNHVLVKTHRYFAPVFTLTSAPLNRASLVLLKGKKKSDPAFWEIRYRHSRIWVSRFAFLFSNSQLAKADNARLIANLVNASLSGKGRVIFDDMHQGSTKLYDEHAFFHDSRLHNTVWFVFAFWLLYIIGHTNRIAPVPRPESNAKVADFVHAMANLFARRLNQVASARLLFSHFFDWIRLKYSLPTNGQPVWQLLERTERIDKTDVAILKRYFSDVEKNRKVNLVKLVNRMQKIRSTL